jgi:hypothetical protein
MFTIRDTIYDIANLYTSMEHQTFFSSSILNIAELITGLRNTAIYIYIGLSLASFLANSCSTINNPHKVAHKFQPIGKTDQHINKH